MIKWQSVPLGSIISIKKGSKIEPSEYTDKAIRFIQIDDLRNNSNIKYCLPNPKYTDVRGDDIIIAWDGANAGTIGFGLDGVIGSTLAKLELKDKSQIEVNYIGWLLKGKFKYLQANCTGATIPHVNRKSLDYIKVPLPPPETQKRIAETLDKASQVISLNKKRLEELDALIKATFHDMFGDPVTNEKGWEISRLDEIGTIARGISKCRPRNAPELLGGEHPLVQTGDIAKGDLFINAYTQTYSDLGLAQSKKWRRGTLCITIAANIAKTGILNFDACFPDSVVGFISSAKTNNIFMHCWFSFFQRILEEQAPESAQKNINLRILSELSVIMPPYEKQELFKTIIIRMEEQKDLVKQVINESESLFNSLMNEYYD